MQMDLVFNLPATHTQHKVGLTQVVWDAQQNSLICCFGKKAGQDLRKREYSLKPP